MENDQTAVKDKALASDEETPFLDLSESLKRPVVKGPDGKPYELRTPDEFSVEDEHLLRGELQRFSALQEKSTLNAKDTASLRLRLDKCFDRIIIADDSAKKLFTDRKRQKVLLFFRTGWLKEDRDTIQDAMKSLTDEEEDGADSSITGS